MIPLVLFLLASFGLAFVLGYSELTYGFRRQLSQRGGPAKWLLKLLECPGCVSFHVGWLWIALGGRHFFGASSMVLEALILAFATCGSSLLLAKWAGVTDSAP